ncbi:MAG: patatin-like phospholipase family protein [Devosiaceae bacterium]|nr:patatin-like phospholipase family protein [Devosiaceae bacterium MH13]
MVNLALQGGGAHGAFTWGVLDRLLEDGRLRFEGISGTSAGAMNSVALADGWYEGGREGAREKLEDFWRGISRNGSFSLTDQQNEVLDRFMSFWMWPVLPSGASVDFSKLFPNAPWANPFTSQLTSPYAVNPLNINPLRDVVEQLIDFDRVHACGDFKLFIAATRVFSGKIRVFRRDDVTADAVLASACLPYAFQAVEIDEEPHWDGGYTGNPAIWPFFTETDCEDTILIQINPIERRETPKTSQEILERISEITFNASLLREFRAIDFVNRLIEEGRLEGAGYKKNRLHRIDASEELAALGAGSKFNTSWAFFTRLRDIGRDAASGFLEAHYVDVGKRATLDLRSAFS